jgi:multiple sugar transport system substrate-binding protein
MSRPRLGNSQPLGLPPSVAAMSIHRRQFLRGSLGVAAAIGGSSLLAACGGDDGGSGGGGGGGGTVKFGINEAKGSGPAYDRLKGMADAYQKKSGVTVDLNAVDHNTFQESLNTYLQGSPDDVFTWFAGFRMAQLAENGLITDISDVWPIDGMSDAFKQAATAPDGNQYFVPVSYYPWAVFYRKSVFEKNNFQVPETYDDFTSLMDEMQGKGITPFAFGDKDGWPAMGTFDILNMRINGFDFHMSLMKGDEDWDSNEVKKVFETWAGLLKYHQADPLGRTWQEAATSMGNGECGMYLLGTFVTDGIPDVKDLDFFTYPTLDESIGNDALDAPIDGFCVAAGGPDQDAGKAMIKWLGTPEAADAGNNNADAPFIAANQNASTDTYTELQKKSVDVVSAASNIAQFLDRDTNSDFASTVIIPSLQDFLRKPDDIDGITASIQQQKSSIF